MNFEGGSLCSMISKGKLAVLSMMFFSEGKISSDIFLKKKFFFFLFFLQSQHRAWLWAIFRIDDLFGDKWGLQSYYISLAPGPRPLRENRQLSLLNILSYPSNFHLGEISEWGKKFITCYYIFFWEREESEVVVASGVSGENPGIVGFTEPPQWVATYATAAGEQ